MAQLALNSRPNSAIGGISPFFLRHGYELGPLMELTPSTMGQSRHPGKINATKYLERLKDAQDFTQAAMASIQQRNESNANRTRRQPERFKVGEKLWLNLKNINTPQLSKILAWQHAKYEVTAVPDALTFELNVPGNIHKRFHVELVKRAGNDPFPSQVRDDAQNTPIVDGLNEPEYEIETILRARTVSRGRGSYRQALVKWIGWADPTWEPIEYVKETVALEEFEKKYGSIENNDGYPQESMGAHVGPPEMETTQKRKKRHKRQKK